MCKHRILCHVDINISSHSNDLYASITFIGAFAERIFSISIKHCERFLVILEFLNYHFTNVCILNVLYSIRDYMCCRISTLYVL